MKYLKKFESVEEKTWVEVGKSEYYLSQKSSIHNRISNFEFKYLSNYLDQYKKKIFSHFVDSDWTSFIQIGGFSDYDDKKLTIYKNPDEYFTIALTWGGIGYTLEKYYRCDQISGIIDFMESNLLSRLSKKDDPISLKAQVRRMVTQLTDENVLKVKAFIESL